MNIFSVRTIVTFSAGVLFTMFILPWIQTQWASFRR